MLAFVSERSLGEIAQLAVEPGVAQRLLVESNLGVFELQDELKDACVLSLRRRTQSISDA